MKNRKLTPEEREGLRRFVKLLQEKGFVDTPSGRIWLVPKKENPPEREERCET